MSRRNNTREMVRRRAAKRKRVIASRRISQARALLRPLASDEDIAHIEQQKAQANL